MNTLKVLFWSSFFILNSFLAYGQSWEWAKGGYESMKTDDWFAPVAADLNGNGYITGQYTNSIIFGSDTLRCSQESTFLVKYNSSGILQWAQQPDGNVSGTSFGVSVTTDHLGSVFITGYFEDTVEFNSIKLSSPFWYSSFIVKYSSSGNVLWAKQSLNQSSRCYATPNSVVTDKWGNSYITGHFKDSVYFGSILLKSNNDPTNGYNAFLVKYDSTGKLIWAKQSITPSYSEYSNGISNSVTVDKDGNPYITGFFSDTIHFDLFTLIGVRGGVTGGNIFVVKYDTSGKVLWANQSTPCFAQGSSVITDNEGNAYITGQFGPTIGFGTFTLTTSSGQVYLVKFNPQGDVIWAYQSSIGQWSGMSLSKDANDNIYLGGWGTGDSIMFGGKEIKNAPNNIRSLLYSTIILKIDTSGRTLCGTILTNGTYNNYEVGVASDSSGNDVYMTGTFEFDSLFCGPDTLIANSGAQVPYLAKWQSCDETESISQLKAENKQLQVFPNPFTNTTTIALNTEGANASLWDKHYLEVDDLTGRDVMHKVFTGTQYELNAQALAKGLYFVRVFDEGKNVIGASKIVVQ